MCFKCFIIHSLGDWNQSFCEEIIWGVDNVFYETTFNYVQEKPEKTQVTCGKEPDKKRKSRMMVFCTELLRNIAVYECNWN